MVTCQGYRARPTNRLKCTSRMSTKKHDDDGRTRTLQPTQTKFRDPKHANDTMTNTQNIQIVQHSDRNKMASYAFDALNNHRSSHISLSIQEDDGISESMSDKMVNYAFDAMNDNKVEPLFDLVHAFIKANDMNCFD
eukprot:231977_1